MPSGSRGSFLLHVWRPSGPQSRPASPQFCSWRQATLCWAGALRRHSGAEMVIWGTLSTLLKSCLFFFSKMCVQALHRNTTLPGLSLCPCSFKKTAVSVLHTQLRPAHTGDLAGLKSRRVNMPIEIGPSRTFQLLENSQCWL